MAAQGGPRLIPRRWNSFRHAVGVFDSSGEAAVVAAEMLNELLDLGPAEEASVDPEIYAWLALWCGDMESAVEGRRLHAHMTRYGRDQSPRLATLLVRMHGRCRDLNAARSTFDRIPEHNTFSWNTLVSAYARNNLLPDSLALIRLMPYRGIRPDVYTFLPVLSLVASHGCLADARMTHRLIISHGLESNPALQRSLLNAYCKHDGIESARQVFNAMVHLDSASVSTMIAAYTHVGRGEEALALFQRIEMEKIEEPNKATFLALLNACASLASLKDGKAIHECISNTTYRSDLTMQTALMNMYGKCGSIKDAQVVFNNIREHDLVSWTSMIGAYAHNGHGKEALELFNQMELQRLTPDRVTFLHALSACANIGSLVAARAIHNCINTSTCHMDIIVRTSLIDVYGKCGSLEDARVVFCQTRWRRDPIIWNALITACARNGYGDEGLGLFRRMRSLEGVKQDIATLLSCLDACANSVSPVENGRIIHECIVSSGFESNVSLQTALIDMYGKCGSLRDARAVFDEMKRRDSIVWNAMLAVYVRNGHGKEAIELLRLMNSQGPNPDKVTFLGAVNACAILESLEAGKGIHLHIVARGFESDDVLKTALVSMYGKCGNVKEARSLFNEINQRDAISWTAMIGTYALNGHDHEALEAFQQMELQGLKPERITFLTVLNACANLSSLGSGRAIHKNIIDSGLNSDVAVMTALLDMYGKCASLKDAHMVFDEINEVDLIPFNAMIAAYANNGCIEGALNLFQILDSEGLIPDRITFLNILNACSHRGLFDKAWHVFVSINGESGITTSVDHYDCLIDLLGRAGRLAEVEDLIENMPFLVDNVALLSFMGACRIHGVVE